ncbi:hypothetical protein HBB16_13075 [Pseudonocardia sp. MCCB 268]|nr:hypothetical protein [Pseudonocardia cytotoxica]
MCCLVEPPLPGLSRTVDPRSPSNAARQLRYIIPSENPPAARSAAAVRPTALRALVDPRVRDADRRGGRPQGLACAFCARPAPRGRRRQTFPGDSSPRTGPCRSTPARSSGRPGRGSSAASSFCPTCSARGPGRSPTPARW